MTRLSGDLLVSEQSSDCGHRSPVSQTVNNRDAAKSDHSRPLAVFVCVRHIHTQTEMHYEPIIIIIITNVVSSSSSCSCCNTYQTSTSVITQRSICVYCMGRASMTGLRISTEPLCTLQRPPSYYDRCIVLIFGKHR